MMSLRNRIVLGSLTAIGTFLQASVASAEQIRVATWNIQNLTAENRTSSEFRELEAYGEELEADIIALQEVDGENAVVNVFSATDYDFYFSSRRNPQRTGFAVRKGLTVQQNPDYEALNTSGGLRYGTDITVTVNGQDIRLLSVHLKSGCFARDLDSGNLGDSCRKLKAQVPVLESWIDDRASAEVPFIVLGDFNRRLTIDGDDVWSEIDDAVPANADLTNITEGRTSDCWEGQFPQYIDHIVLDKLSQSFVVRNSFEQNLFSKPFSSRSELKELQKKLSDHCAISVALDISSSPTNGSGETTPVTRESILERIEDIERKIQEIRQLLNRLES